MFHDRSLLGRCFRGFVLPVLEYWSAGWCSAADTHLKLLSGARFLTEVVFVCDLAHRRSVAVLCMLYKIRCNPVHPLNGALPGPYVPVRVSPRTLLVTPYSMVWDLRVSVAGPMLFYWPKLLYPYYSQLYSFSLSSFWL